MTEVQEAYRSVVATLARRIEWEHQNQRTATPPDVMKEVRFLMATVARSDNPTLLTGRAADDEYEASVTCECGAVLLREIIEADPELMHYSPSGGLHHYSPLTVPIEQVYKDWYANANHRRRGRFNAFKAGAAWTAPMHLTEEQPQASDDTPSDRERASGKDRIE